ncbi:hypothetical protein V5799_029464, partial [Amblyomma americanum]
HARTTKKNFLYPLQTGYVTLPSQPTTFKVHVNKKRHLGDVNTGEALSLISGQTESIEGHRPAS